MKPMKKLVVKNEEYEIVDATARNRLDGHDDLIDTKADSAVVENEIDKINKMTKYLPYFVTYDDYTSLEGMNNSSLFNWSTDKFYGLYDDLELEKHQVGYASKADGTRDLTLPIYSYVYHPIISQKNTGDTIKKAFFTSGIHGNEKLSAYGLYVMMKEIVSGKSGLLKSTLANLEIHVIPICNPFGWNYSIGSTESEAINNKGRYNARGVDLNRNFPKGWTAGGTSGSSSSSEIETASIINYISTTGTNNAVLMYDFHTTFNDSEHGDSQVFAQLSTFTYADTSIANDIFNELISIETLVHHVDIDSQFINVSLPVRKYSGMLSDYMASVSPSFIGCGLFEGTKRYYEDGGYIYNDHRSMAVFIDYIINALCRILNNKKNKGMYNICSWAYSTEDSWSNTSVNRIDSVLNIPTNKHYIIEIANHDYAYNVRNNSGNIGFSSDARIINPASGYTYDVLIKRRDEKLLTKFDLLADIGLKIIPID